MTIPMFYSLLCKCEETFLVRRMGNKIYAWRAKNIGTKARSHIMDRYDCLVLYDPAEVDDGDGAKYNLGNRQ
jgi:hypothetical protein